MENQTNELANESSPYLLQHAENPVHWKPWGDEAFAKARKENKLVIVSIGYSACHWCHVMAHESFEDPTVAQLMNEHFISIKVDREERPDVDNIYMTALQMMTGQGGWPLNVVTLPDGRPIWGATYLPKKNWMSALRQIQKVYKNDSDKVAEYATKLTKGIRQVQLIPDTQATSEFKPTDADNVFQNLKSHFDPEKGGMQGAPKFPMPVALEFLLHYGHTAQNQEALDQLQLTLKNMAYGGIYDQVGGGFARYSTDTRWKVPHFEKMLYDNAQLISLYSRAYRQNEDPLYKRTVEQTLTFIEREMTDNNGAFYSALDADSEGEEGKFYVWTEEELQKLIPEKDWPLFQDFYNVDSTGLWEHGKYILLRDDDPEHYQKEYNLSAEKLQSKVENWRSILLEARSKRIRPGLDDKSLTSWNALMLSAYLDTYKALKKDKYLKAARQNARWIMEQQTQEDGSLYHSFRQGKSHVDGLLEDYALAAEAFLDLYEVTFEEKYLRQARQWIDFAQQNFRDSGNAFFYTRNLQKEQLIAQTIETADNVTPSANSVMAHNLFRLGHLLGNKNYRKQAEKMVQQLKPEIEKRGTNYGNWAQLLTQLSYPFYEVAISGPKANERYREMTEHYLPQAVVVSATEESDLPLLENRFSKGQTQIFVCQNRVCQLPVQEVSKALEQME